MIREAVRGVWCDYCKDKYGWNAQLRDWNLKAKKQAWVTVVSESQRGNGIRRSYCLECANEITTWHDGSIFTLNQQCEAAKAGEVLHV